MADPATWMVIISAAGAGYSIYAGERAEDVADKRAAEMEAQGRENAKLIEAETQEQARRVSAQQREAESMALAKAAASGVQVSGSTKDYLSDMSTENKRQLDWLKKSGKSKANLARSGAYVSASGVRESGTQAKYGGYSDAVKTAGTTIAKGADEGWW